MSNSHLSLEYEQAITDLIKTDENLPRLKILSYLPIYCFEQDSIIDNEEVIETFDVFKIKRMDTGRECYLCYSDYLSYKFVGIKTIKKYLKQYKIK